MKREGIKLILSLLEKADQKMMKMLLILNNRMDKKKTRKILLRIISLKANKSRLIMNFSQKSNWWIV